jgi:hypothetical protein
VLAVDVHELHLKIRDLILICATRTHGQGQPPSGQE